MATTLVKHWQNHAKTMSCHGNAMILVSVFELFDVFFDVNHELRSLALVEYAEDMDSPCRSDVVCC